MKLLRHPLENTYRISSKYPRLNKSEEFSGYGWTWNPTQNHVRMCSMLYRMAYIEKNTPKLITRDTYWVSWKYPMLNWREQFSRYGSSWNSIHNHVRMCSMYSRHHSWGNNCDKGQNIFYITECLCFFTELKKNVSRYYGEMGLINHDYINTSIFDSHFNRDTIYILVQIVWPL